MREKSEFVADIPSSGFFFTLLLRSPVARGILKGIKTPVLPNKVNLITAADIPGINRLEGPGGFFPVLAENELSYIGEPAAILAGPDETVLTDIARECQVMVDEMPPVFDASRAKTAARRRFSLGDTGAVFNRPEILTVEGVYTTDCQDAWCTEPNGALAIPFEISGKTGVIIHTASQWPFHVKHSVARILGISGELVDFRPARLGHHMDGKFLYPSLCSCHAALAAWITGKAAKLILQRTEDFRFSPKRVKTEIALKSALDKDGRILAAEAVIRADMGSSPIFAEEILDRVALGALGVYHHETLSLNAEAVMTNTPPAGPLAGFGFAQGFFAAERHASRIADALREDPAEWRKNVFLAKGSKFAIGGEIRENLNLESLLDMAASMSDYRRKWAAFELLRRPVREEDSLAGIRASCGEKLRGIGIAAAFQGSGLLYPLGEKKGVELTLEKDLSLKIKTSMAAYGEEQIYPWKTIAARELGVEEDMVLIVTEGKHLPDSGPACLSRNVTVVTRLVELACEAIKKRRFRDPLPITVRRYYKPSCGAAWGTEAVYDENSLSAPGCCAAVVETEIDLVEYIPRVRGIWLAVDGGSILAETRARKNLTLYAIQAINWASRENVVYRDGSIPAAYIHHYPLPENEAIPPIKIDFLWSDGPGKGIGELPFTAIPAAYVQSVSQAMDHPFTKIPTGSVDIWNYLETKTEKT